MKTVLETPDGTYYSEDYLLKQIQKAHWRGVHAGVLVTFTILLFAVILL